MAMACILSGDIGGTKTLLKLSAADDELTPLLQKSYASAAYAGLVEIVDEFLSEAEKHDISSACFALAGPVAGGVGRLTNLPWVVNGKELEARYGIKRVALINDFEAVGHGVEPLQTGDLLTLQSGVEDTQGVRMVVGAGTGLGVAWLSEQEGEGDPPTG